MRKIAVWGALLAVLGIVTTSYSDESGLEFRDRLHGQRIAASRPAATEPISVVATSPEPLPADAQALVTSFDNDSAAIRQKAEQEIQAKRQSLIVTLQTLQDSYTRDAKLDEAVAIRDTIRQLKVSHLKPLLDPGMLYEYANRIGETFYFDVTGQVGHTIWGSEVYTADSYLATAAVHAGVLKVGQRGIVKVTMVKSPDTHRGSTANGVSSSNWGTYGTSYTVERPNFDSMPPLKTRAATP